MRTTTTYDRRAIFGWAMFDFANSSFSSLVLTFVFSTYFTKSIAPTEIEGTALWSRALAVSGVTVALLSPFVGALADRGGLRKQILFGLTVMTVLGTASLFTAVPGAVMQALVLFVIANMGMEMGMVFYNSFLPDIAPPDRIGRISGYGWSFGYVGGLLAMVIAMQGFVTTDTPLFGFVKENGENIRATNLLVAAWIAVFSIPLFLWVRDKKVANRPAIGVLLKSTVQQLQVTFHEIRKYRQIARLLLARIFYNDAILTIFSFGGIYAAGTFDFTFDQILVFGIVLNVAAGFGAFALGFLDDKLGGKMTIQITNCGFIVATLIAVFAPNQTWFWVAGIMVGLLSGPNQAASRSLMGRFVPEDKESEFFGFYALSGKATAFVGPLLLGILTKAFDSQRVGISVVVVLFAVGGLLLKRVNETEGKALAGRVERKA